MALLGGWEGHAVGTVERFEAGVKGPRCEVWIELHPKVDGPLVSDACGDKADGAHDHEERRVRDLPVFDADTWLLVHRRRVWCGRCGGPNLERVPWLPANARVTARLAILEPVVQPGDPQPHRAAQILRPQAHGLPAGHRGSLPLAIEHQHP